MLDDLSISAQNAKLQNKLKRSNNSQESYNSTISLRRTELIINDSCRSFFSFRYQTVMACSLNVKLKLERIIDPVFGLLKQLHGYDQPTYAITHARQKQNKYKQMLILLKNRDIPIILYDIVFYKNCEFDKSLRKEHLHRNFPNRHYSATKDLLA